MLDRGFIFDGDRHIEEQVTNLGIVRLLVGDLLSEDGGLFRIADLNGGADQAGPQSQAIRRREVIVVFGQFLQAAGACFPSCRTKYWA